jgi:hypothetical protein
MESIRLAVVVIAGAALTTACASRPSHQELTDAIILAVGDEPDITLTSDEAGCIATELLASNLSDTTLAGLAEDFDNPEVLETEVNDLEPLITAAANTCRG